MTSSPCRTGAPAAKAAPPASWLRRVRAFAPWWLGGRDVGERLKRRAHCRDVLRRLNEARRQHDEAVRQAIVAIHESPDSLYAQRAAELAQSLAELRGRKVSLLEESLMMAGMVDRLLRPTATTVPLPGAARKVSA